MTAPEVFFNPEISAQGILKAFEPLRKHVRGKVGIKLHFGEPGNQHFLDPALLRPLAESLDATLIESNVLYAGRRRYTKSHIEVALEHGFDFAPIDILDARGVSKLTREGLRHLKEFHLPTGLDDYDTIISYAHFKGHLLTGFGGAIKNIGMGMAAIPGKMAMHASAIPSVIQDKCTVCELCLSKCPVSAITIQPVQIDETLCIGCASCVGFCPAHVFQVPWGSTDPLTVMERMVEYAMMAAEGRNMIYLNVAGSISKDCDCMPTAPAPFMQDVGVFSSTDILAVETASCDEVDKAYGKKDAFSHVNQVGGRQQLDYAKELGMGSDTYRLVRV